MAERVHSCLRVGRVAGQGREHDARRAQHDRQRSRPIDADPQRRRGLVAGACGDGHAGGGLPRHVGRLERAWQPGRIEVELLQQLVAPPAVGDIEEQRSRRVGDVGRALGRQAEPDVVLRQQHVGDSPEHVRLVAAQPEQLRGGEARQRAIAGELHEAGKPDPLLDLRALELGALVVPEDRRAQHAGLLVEDDEPVHLPREADRGRLGAERGERTLGCSPPVLGILLGPAGTRRGKVVFLLGPCEHLAFGRERERLDARRADVEADEPRHPPSAA